jgi:hypothetical protein
MSQDYRSLATTRHVAPFKRRSRDYLGGGIVGAVLDDAGVLEAVGRIGTAGVLDAAARIGSGRV